MGSRAAAGASVKTGRLVGRVWVTASSFGSAQILTQLS